MEINSSMNNPPSLVIEKETCVEDKVVQPWEEEPLNTNPFIVIFFVPPVETTKSSEPALEKVMKYFPFFLIIS